MLKKELFCEKGMVTPLVLIILAIFFVFATSIMSWSLSETRNVVSKERNTEALQVAEAGVSYYKWHLAHNGNDYKDGKSWCCNGNSSSTPATCGGACGPYIETYKDYNGNTIGEFDLTITPSAVGSTIMQVKSVGKIYEDASIQETVTAKLGKESLAKYSFLTNSPIWIGENESTSGPLHSNGGIRFDGTCNSEVTSAVTSYDAGAANHGVTGTKPGIWGSTDPAITQYWSFPEPTIDFGLFTVDMAGIKTSAQSGGIYLAASGANGYKLVFRSDGKIDKYKVTSVNQSVTYANDSGGWSSDQEGVNATTSLGTVSMPANGVIFAQDNVWVQGTVKGKVTVAVSKFATSASNYARIIISDNTKYLARDGSNALGLMAEGDILIPKSAPDNLTIDGVMLSQKGHVYRRYYSPVAIKTNIEVYGGIITNLFWTWTWVNSDDSTIVTDGYRNTNTIYDNYLTYGPPPSFPTEANFKIISWSENN
jgi:hypothetical protein